MNKEMIKSFLKLLKCKPAGDQSRSQWVLSDCPMAPWLHDNGKSTAEVFGVKIEQGDSFCNCFSCGFHGSQTDLLIKLRYHNKVKHEKDFDFAGAMKLITEAEDGMEIDFDIPDTQEMLYGGARQQFYEFPDWWIDNYPVAAEVPFAMDYLIKKRGFTPELIRQLDIRADVVQKRVCFPVRDFEGVHMGLHGRAVDEDNPLRYRMYTYNDGQEKHNNPLIWIGEDHVDFDRPIIVAEGPFDYGSIYRVYDNVVSPLFANPSMEKLRRMGGAYEWITFLDHGKAGDKGRERIEQCFPKHDIRHIIPSAEDKDPGAMSISQLQDILGDHVELREKFLV